MKPVAIVYVTNMDRSLEWYRAVLPAADVVSTSPWWSELSVAGTSLALHFTERITPGDQVGLALAADRPLEHVVRTLAEAGIEPIRGIADEAFGRSLVLEDPDGLAIQVNEHDPEHYPRPGS